MGQNDYCINCGTDLIPTFDEDPNGDMGCVCAQCCAEQEHDYDREPAVVFQRDGSRVEDEPVRKKLTVEITSNHKSAVIFALRKLADEFEHGEIYKARERACVKDKRSEEHNIDYTWETV